MIKDNYRSHDFTRVPARRTCQAKLTLLPFSLSVEHHLRCRFLPSRKAVSVYVPVLRDRSLAHGVILKLSFLKKYVFKMQVSFQRRVGGVWERLPGKRLRISTYILKV